MQIINKHSLTVLEVTSRERREEFAGDEWIELQSYVSALRAERDELRDALIELKFQAERRHDEHQLREGLIDEAIKQASAVLAKYAKE